MLIKQKECIMDLIEMYEAGDHESLQDRGIEDTDTYAKVLSYHFKELHEICWKMKHAIGLCLQRDGNQQLQTRERADLEEILENMRRAIAS